MNDYWLMITWSFQPSAGTMTSFQTIFLILLVEIGKFCNFWAFYFTSISDQYSELSSQKLDFNFILTVNFSGVAARRYSRSARYRSYYSGSSTEEWVSLNVIRLELLSFSDYCWTIKQAMCLHVLDPC